MNLSLLEQQYGLPPGLLTAIYNAEGSGPTSVSPKGAKGSFQFMPATAQAYGLNDPTDPEASAVAAAKYMADAEQRYNSADPRVLMAEYNGGPTQAKAVLGGQLPPAKETQAYIAKAPKVDLDALIDSLPPAQGQNNLDAMIAALPDARQKASPQVAQAAASGFNSGALTYLPGLPVKAALDVADLARAGYGYLGSKLGFLTPSQLPEPLDRSQYVMSPQWIQQHIRAAGGGPIIDPANPDSAIARVAHAAGAAVGSSLIPGNTTQVLSNAASAAISGAAGQAATEAGASPAWSILASLSPQAAAQLPAMVARGIIRGGSQGAQQMRDNIQALRDAGIEPSVGLAAGNRRGATMDAVLSMSPGASGVMAKSAGNMQAGMQGLLGNLADSLSANRGTYEAGNAVQHGINAYKDRLSATTGLLYDRVGNLIPQDALFPANQTLAAGSRLSADIPGMPNVSKILKPDVVPKVNAAMTSDAAPTLPVTTTVQSPIVGQNGVPFTSQVTTPGKPGGIAFPAMKDVRTLIGQDLNDALLTSNKNKGALKQYYGALTGDMQTAAAVTDMARMAAAGSLNVPSAVNALNRANRIYGQGQQRLETLQPFASQSAPERAYLSLENSLAGGGSASVGSQVLKSVGSDAANSVAATIIDRLGKATPGQQNAAGTAFSPETFLTNWNRMSDAGKDAAFGAQGTPVRDQVQAVATAADMLRKHNKAWANPSGTAAKSTLYSTAAGITAALLSGHPLVAAGGLLGVGAGYGGARLLTAPGMADRFAAPTLLPINQSTAQILRLGSLPAQ